jgi:outer membrane murein-binding lipoprotein Lpp
VTLNGPVSTLDDHEHYEELCAWAAAGQPISQIERSELDEHLRSCTKCRHMFRVFVGISDSLSAVADVNSTSPFPEGMKARVIARARTEGILLRGDEENPRYAKAGAHPPRGRKALFWAALAASLIVVGTIATRIINSRTAQPRNVERTQVENAGTGTKTEPTSGSAELDRLKRQLDEALTHERAAADKLKSFQEKLGSELQKEADLQARITTLETSGDELRNKEEQASSQVGQLRHQLDELRSERDALRNASSAADLELITLRAKVTTLTAEVDRQRRLNAVSDECSSIRPRNVRARDVQDIGPNGEILRAFGKILYVEGKCLTFYAYDLPDEAVNKSVAFYVWGAKGEKQVKNLGIFHKDDPNDNRWALNFDDPHVLTQIDNVFVTLETGTTVASRPSGKPFLQAFLGNRPKRK